MLPWLVLAAAAFAAPATHHPAWEAVLLVSPALLDFVNVHRAEKIPDGYGYEFLPCDWSLNAR